MKQLLKRALGAVGAFVVMYLLLIVVPNVLIKDFDIAPKWAALIAVGFAIVAPVYMDRSRSGSPEDNRAK